MNSRGIIFNSLFNYSTVAYSCKSNVLMYMPAKDESANVSNIVYTGKDE